MYLLRLDDASEYMDVAKWTQLEELLDSYGIKPIVGIIPNNRDEGLIKHYKRDSGFWYRVKVWESKRWNIALHGYTHVYESRNGGINPVNKYSEFAGLSLDRQREKIKNGVRILKEKGIEPKVFFAPAHSFDRNTLEALKLESQIRVISDTVASDIYYRDGFHFIPQQTGRARKLPLRVVTFCYHPNKMGVFDFNLLEAFIQKNSDQFINFDDLLLTHRRFNRFDSLLNWSYFAFRKVRTSIR